MCSIETFTESFPAAIPQQYDDQSSVENLKRFLRNECRLDNLPYINKLKCVNWSHGTTGNPDVAIPIGTIKGRKKCEVYAVFFPHRQGRQWGYPTLLPFHSKIGNKKSKEEISEMGLVGYLEPFSRIVEGPATKNAQRS